jgi:PHD/YefM family antitoxin component YafN of YafNO toxin-antitoxin module
MAEARDQLTRLPEMLAEEDEAGAAIITRHGKPVLAVLPWDTYESIIETLEILSDKELMASVREGIEQVERGEFIPWEDVKAELDAQ